MKGILDRLTTFCVVIVLLGTPLPVSAEVRVEDGGPGGAGGGESTSGPLYWCRDTDRDGFGDGGDVREAISAPAGFVAIDGDCDDTNPTVNPGAVELCDGLDNDCNGLIDDAIGDADQDGILDCFEMDDDADGVLDSVDNCPFAYNPIQLDLDQDGRGDACDDDDDHDGVPDALDCAPLDVEAFPGAFEACDGKDNDCDGRADEGYKDADQDGRADCIEADDDADGVLDGEDNCPSAYNPVQENQDGDHEGDACDTDDDEDGALDHLDCAPGDPWVYPGATEICDGKDNDCNGEVDEGFSDQDDDGTKDCADPDVDGDGAANRVDNCPSIANPDQNDRDQDGAGDACDTQVGNREETGNGKHNDPVLSAFPNPVRSSTEISFQVPASGGPVRLQIFDVAGRRVAMLVDRDLPAGLHAVRWNGRYENGRQAATGLYFYRLEGPGFSQVAKLALIP